MRSVICRLVILSLVMAVFGCSSTATTPELTPHQVWNGAKVAAQIAGDTYIRAQCKGGKIAGVPCDTAVQQLNAVVVTLAADFKPGATADPAQRAVSRDAAAVQLARALHGDDFAGTDDAAKARQAADVVDARNIVDAVGDALVAALGKQ